MDQDMKIKLKSLLIKHDEVKVEPCVGVKAEDDIDFFFTFLKQNFSWFDDLNENRQCAIIDLCFFGLKNFLSHDGLIDALSNADFHKASQEITEKILLNTRTKDIAEIIRTGELSGVSQ